MAVLLAVCGLSLWQSAYANTPIFVYTNRDLMLCFRQSGANNDLEVDIGQASRYYGATPGSTITIGQFTTAQLNGFFSTINGLTWSVGAGVRVGDGGDTSVPVGTLWVTAPRLDPTVQTSPWARNSSSTQGATASKIKSILDNASFYSGTVSASSTSNNTSAVAVPVGSDHEYGFFMGTLGNYGGTFEGDVENTTSGTFTTGGTPSRSDLYELRPDSTGTQPAGKYLGYFEFGTTGTMTFHAGVSAPPAPTLNITAANSTVNISFQSVTGGTYTLFSTNSAGLTAPIHTWPASSTTIAGDGTVKSFQVPVSGASQFYSVSVH